MTCTAIAAYMGLGNRCKREAGFLVNGKCLCKRHAELEALVMCMKRRKILRITKERIAA